MAVQLVVLLLQQPSQAWRVCDVTDDEFGAVGNGITKATASIRAALTKCDEVWLPRGHSFLSGPLNLTSNQVLRVDGTLLASTDKHDYPLVAPLMGYGWGDDENCFDPSLDKHKIIVGSLRYSPVIGAFHAKNVTITGAGTIDGQGAIWWQNCTKCHYPPNNDPSFCLVASRPKLIETQYVDGFRVLGAKSTTPLRQPPGMEKCRVTTVADFVLSTSHAVPGVHGAYDAFTPHSGAWDKHVGAFCGDNKQVHTHAPIAFSSDAVSLDECQHHCTALNCTCFDFLSAKPPSPAPAPPQPDWSRTLTLQNSPFWTLTPSYTQNIHVRDLRILAPMDRIGNTDGVNLDSCRNALVENIWIRNSDDGVCIKSGLNGFGLNLAVPTENVLIRNITCPEGGRGGFALGSEMSGGMRNITYRDSILHGERGIHIKPSVGRGGYMRDVLFENIITRRTSINMGHDGQTLMPANNYVPLISNLRFANISGGCNFGGCASANRSQCFNLTVVGSGPHCRAPASEDLPPQRYSCKRVAHTMFGVVDLPWPVCIPLDAPVNLRPDYPNWGPMAGNYTSIEACRAACV